MRRAFKQADSKKKGLKYLDSVIFYEAMFFGTGFIDFIVDPSFQVMGDMLDKILSPLHKQEQSARNIDEAISEEVFEDKVNRSSGGSSLSSRPSTPKTPLSPGTLA